MNTQSQYGHPVLLDGFDDTSSAVLLKKLQFCGTATESSPYDERWLQRLIMQHPSVLPIDQIEPVFSPLIPVCRELPMQVGSLDNLFITPKGDITLVECKLWRNPEARRKVIGQVIDYAQNLANWTYEQLESACKKGKQLSDSDEGGFTNLYQVASAKGEIDEATFHDNVSRNLRRGRFLLLIVGDGIRDDMKAMAQFVQGHAGFHFTLAFVELALFETAAEQYIVQPRVLAQTTLIERGIVTVQDGRIVINAPTTTPLPGNGLGRRTTITQELFFEELERELPGSSENLNAFLSALAELDVSPEFGTETMILRWNPGIGKSWNLGCITKSGLLWMDFLGQQAQSSGMLDLHEQYIRTLASLVPDAYIRETPKKPFWYVARDGKCITVDVLVADSARRAGWVRAIRRFQSGVAAKGSQQEEQISSAEPERGRPAANGVPEIVLRVGSEGGEILLVRQKNASGRYEYWVARDESTLADALDEEDLAGTGALHSSTSRVTSLDEAFGLLDRYPWCRLVPLEIDPNLLPVVLREVKRRGGTAEEKRWLTSLEQRSRDFISYGKQPD